MQNQLLLVMPSPLYMTIGFEFNLSHIWSVTLLESKNKKYSVKCDQYIKHFSVHLTCFDPKGSSLEVHQHNKEELSQL
jgi:hypothetical protein